MRAWNQNRESLVEPLMRTLAVALLTVAITACSGGSHSSLPSPTTTTAPKPSLCKASQVEVNATQVVPPLGGALQLVAAVSQPLNGVVTATNATGARCTVAVPSNGEFTMNLPAGTYWLTGTSPRFNGGSTPCRATYPVVLRPRPNRSFGGPVLAIVTCDGF